MIGSAARSTAISLLIIWLCFTKVLNSDAEEKYVEKVVDRIPVFITQPISKLVDEGNQIRLPCFVDHLEGFVLLWKVGDTILTVGDRVINNQDTRTTITKESDGNWLTIDGAGPGDGGEYTCHISAFHPKEIIHNVLVRTRPVLKPVEDEVIVKSGSNATLECYIKEGQPTPYITWSRQDGAEIGSAVPGSGAGAPTEGTVIILVNVTRHNAGTYRCNGDNGFGGGGLPADEQLDGLVNLVVEHKPVILPEDYFLQYVPGKGLRLTCHVYAQPLPDVTWRRGEFALSSLEYNITLEGEDLHVVYLTADQVIRGNYSCTASNKFGKATKTITVSDKVGPFKLTSAPMGNSSTEYLASWEAESASPVNSFLLTLYEDDKQVAELSVKPSGHSGTTWSGRALLEGLNPSTFYTIRLSGSNNPHSGDANATTKSDQRRMGPSSTPDFIFGTAGANQLQLEHARWAATHSAFGHFYDGDPLPPPAALAATDNAAGDPKTVGPISWTVWLLLMVGTSSFL